MIVLDEQLLGLGMESRIGAWYRGSLRFVIDLRPNTVIKDDAIPRLLGRERHPAFVTINVRHFWRRELTDPRFCVVCFPLLDKDVPEISDLLKCLFRYADFKTKRQRAGHVFRVCLDRRVQFYRYGNYERQDLVL